MQSQRGVSPLSTQPWLGWFGRHLPILLFLLLATAGMLTVYWFFSPVETTAEALTVPENSLSAPLFKNVPSKPVVQRLAQSPGPLRIGIIVGHRGSDSGAVCDDGLTELQVNTNIAEQVYAQLVALGVQTDLLDEFDPRLQNYHATALISVHADSCVYFNELATGFKIAGSSFTDSSSLSICVEHAYADTTQMFYHENTITPHMTDYHAFREISPGVPAIIIETGFMNLDREMLTTRADVPVRGIVDGIRCFLGK
ncbi:MAG: N-acetylmuramoyl-L-alanine amidase [Anaerolineales bacterium]|nr:N-acetylmuramoyl-L-alanine amidase [Anaerolineales bacterium]